MKRIRLAVAALSLLAAGAAPAEVVIVAGAQSALPALTLQQAEQLYLGRTRNLPDGTGLTLADLPAGPLRDEFYLRLTGKNPSQIRAYWSRMVFTGRALPPQEASDIRQLRQWLTADPQLIGYIAPQDVDARVRVLLRLP